jgi:probable phosphoglycerate mutase
MKLTLIRHAQPAWTYRGRMVGNPTLTDLGRRQAHQLAARTWHGIDELWVSELRRARETAAPLAEMLGLTPKVHSWMNEIGDPVEWDGMPIRQVKARISTLEGAPSLERLWRGVRRGEPYFSFRERIENGLTGSLKEFGVKRLETDQPGLWQDGQRKSIILVAHGGTNAVIHETLLGCGPMPIAWRKFRSLHTGVSVVRTSPMADAVMFALESFGDVTHLSSGQITE